VAENYLKAIKTNGRPWFPNPHIMGLLSLGTPLDWDQAKNFAEHVRSHGVTQFLNTWDRLKDRRGDELLWGDEVLAVTGRVPAMTTHSRPL